MGQVTPDFFAKIRQMEGGYQAHPSDSGNYNSCGQLAGTNIGIAAKSYETYTKTKCVSKGQMQAITPEFATGFYSWYGRHYRLDEIENQTLYEICFNNTMGNPKEAARCEQRALNQFGYNLVEDGARGSRTIAALNDAAKQNLPMLYNAILNEWTEFLYTTKPVFRDGLLNRVEKHFPAMPGLGLGTIQPGGAALKVAEAAATVRGATKGSLPDVLAVLGGVVGLALLVGGIAYGVNTGSL